MELRTTANAGGDLLVAGASNGANLRRIDATGATVYTAPLPVMVDNLQAGPAGDAYLIGPRMTADLGCGPLSTSGDWYAARISPTGTCMPCARTGKRGSGTIARALAGCRVAGWPDDPAVVALVPPRPPK